MERRSKYTCLLFGEGRKDKNFLYSLIELEKFKYHTEQWHFNLNNAHGCSPKDVVKMCKQITTGSEHLVLCFIDLDTLKFNHVGTWNKEKINLEEYVFSFGISIIWQEDSLEDEMKRVIGEKYTDKNKINKIAKIQIEKFINSDYWRKIIEPIKNKEKELKNKDNGDAMTIL